MEPLLGSIIAAGFNFAPRGWAHCNGQLLAISSNSALFSLLGTIYGGDGRTTFALPELRGRVPVHSGGGTGSAGPGLTLRRLGERGGAETTTLFPNNLPSHRHDLTGVTATTTLNNLQGSMPVYTVAGEEDESDPSGGVLANTGRDLYTSSAANGTYGGGITVTGDATTAIGGSTDFTGANTAFNNVQPYTAINFIIALQGLFPSRN